MKTENILNSIKKHKSLMQKMEYEQKEMYVNYIHTDLLNKEGKEEYFYYKNGYWEDGYYPIYAINPQTKERDNLGSLNCLGILINLLLEEIDDIRDLIGDINVINEECDEPIKDWEHYVYNCFEHYFNGSKRKPNKTTSQTIFKNGDFYEVATENENFNNEKELFFSEYNTKLKELKELKLDFNKGAELIKNHPIKIVAQQLYHESKNKNPNIKFYTKTNHK